MSTMNVTFLDDFFSIQWIYLVSIVARVPCSHPCIPSYSWEKRETAWMDVQVKWPRPREAIFSRQGRHWFKRWLVANIVSVIKLVHCWLDKWERNSMKFQPKYNKVQPRNYILLSAQWHPFCLDLESVNSLSYGFSACRQHMTWTMVE